jgi:hypothetical protein
MTCALSSNHPRTALQQRGAPVCRLQKEVRHLREVNLQLQAQEASTSGAMCRTPLLDERLAAEAVEVEAERDALRKQVCSAVCSSRLFQESRFFAIFLFLDFCRQGG